jgi:diaminohydroxyphosphoribosylaminopyrimidine deaminase/5-amino-6-(5-phosphoribosylamino)uracil reductase
MAEPQASQADERWLRRAIELSQRCPPSATAFSVGVVVVGRDGDELASGFSRETGPAVHAEEAALAKLPGAELGEATIYSSMEPCSIRRSRPVPCAQLIIAAGVGRVVFALREPPAFVQCRGVEELIAAGVAVVEMSGLAAEVERVNAHILTR